MFNWIGYRLMIIYWENKADVQLEMQLDNDNYDPSQLISIKTPAAHLSFYSNSGQFERVDGQVEINGIQYKYVKKRLYNDSLEYLCIPDQNLMKIQSAKNEIFTFVNDLKHGGQQKKSGTHIGHSKNSTSEYFPVAYDDYNNIAGISVDHQSYSPFSMLPQITLRAIEHPPQSSQL